MNNNIGDVLGFLITQNKQLKNIFKKQKINDSVYIYEGDYIINSKKYEDLSYELEPCIMIDTSGSSVICIMCEVVSSIDNLNKVQILDRINQINCETATANFFIKQKPDVTIGGKSFKCLDQNICASCYYYYNEKFEAQVFYDVVDDYLETIKKYIDFLYDIRY